MLSQIQLLADIGKMLTDKYGIKEAEARHWNAMIGAANLLCAEFNRPRVGAESCKGLAAWVCSDDVGLSSLAMARKLAPLAGLGECPPHRYQTHGNYPHDPDDLSRCLKLLRCVPELRAHLGAMAECGPVWAGYVAQWDEMERLFAEEAPTKRCPKLYALMKTIESAARKQP
jgi:hypothetical protein